MPDLTAEQLWAVVQCYTAACLAVPEESANEQPGT